MDSAANKVCVWGNFFFYKRSHSNLVFFFVWKKNGNDWKVLNCSFFKWMGAGHHGETGTPHGGLPRFFIPLPNYPPRHSLWLLSLFVLPTEHLEQNKHFCNASVCLRNFVLPTWHSAIVLCQERQLTNSVMLNWIQDPSRANTPSVQGCINI